MTIYINAEKEKHNCDNCQHLGNDEGCIHPDYENFIMDAVRTGFCQGFEEKEREKNGK